MGFLKNLIYGDPETQGMMYRIRVFDRGYHIKSATVKARGQEGINLVVKPKDYYILGEEVKLKFMINPEIPPKIFGNVMELDFDVRDSTQLADLFDLCPDLVRKVNENFYKTMKSLRTESENTIDAEFTDKTNDSLTALTDPTPEPVTEPQPEFSELEKKAEKIPGVKAITSAIDTVISIPHNTRVKIQGVKYLYDIDGKQYEEKQEAIKKALDFCSQPGNAKCLRWLPKYLNLEPEIMAIVSQTELDGVGIMPMYYIKQSAAEISEKMLQRPKVAEDWKTTLIYAAVALGLLLLIVFCVLKLAGKI